MSEKSQTRSSLWLSLCGIAAILLTACCVLYGQWIEPYHRQERIFAALRESNKAEISWGSTKSINSKSWIPPRIQVFFGEYSSASVRTTPPYPPGQFGDDDLKLLTRMPFLRSVSLSNLTFTSEGIVSLFRSKTIYYLRLNNTKINDTGAFDPPPMPSLRILDLEGHGNGRMISTQTLGTILERAPLLTRLHLNGQRMPPWSVTTMKKIAALEHLEELHLVNFPLTDEHLAQLAGVKKLKRLDLSDNPEITEEAIRAFCEKHPTCQVSHSR